MNKSFIKKMLLTLLLLSFITLLFYSTYNIYLWIYDSNKTNKLITDIQKEVIIEDSKEDNSKIIEQANEIPEANPYWDYIKMDLININLNQLKQVNNDIKGWIQVNGTNINYPFVQANNNDFYLSHTIDKSYNSAGWVFLDYRNNLTNNKNNIIYAHGRMDKTMFGSLKNILSNEWINNTNNYVIKISAEKENTLWQIYSIYHLPTTNDYLQINFKNDEEFDNFNKMLINRSIYNFNTNVYSNDKILTLSTCYNNSEKLVLHAKLIKYETK